MSDSNLDYLIKPICDELLARRALIGDGAAQSDNPMLLIDCNPPTTPAHATKFVSLFDCNNPYDYLASIGDEKFQCVIANLQLDWVGFKTQIKQIFRILTPGGHFLFSSFGPDTLATLNQAWSVVDNHPHSNQFQDMHVYGDMLLAAGFMQAVVDTDWLTITYPNGRALLSDIRGSGLPNIHPQRNNSLTGKDRLKQLIDALQQRKVNGMLTETFEVIYGSGTKPQQPSDNKTGTRTIKVAPPMR